MGTGSPLGNSGVGLLTSEGLPEVMGIRELAVCINGNMRTFLRDLGIKEDSGEQFEISFQETFKRTLSE